MNPRGVADLKFGRYMNPRGVAGLKSGHYMSPRGLRGWAVPELERRGMVRRGGTPPFLVSRGNKGLTGEWLASRGRIGLRWSMGEDEAKVGWFCVPNWEGKRGRFRSS